MWSWNNTLLCLQLILFTFITRGHSFTDILYIYCIILQIIVKLNLTSVQIKSQTKYEKISRIHFARLLQTYIQNTSLINKCCYDFQCDLRKITPTVNSTFLYSILNEFMQNVSQNLPLNKTLLTTTLWELFFLFVSVNVTRYTLEFSETFTANTSFFTIYFNHLSKLSNLCNGRMFRKWLFKY